MVLVSGCFLIRDSIGDQVTAKSNWSCSIAASAAAELRAGVPTKPCGIDWKNNPGSERKAKTFLQAVKKGKRMNNGSTTVEMQMEMIALIEANQIGRDCLN